MGAVKAFALALLAACSPEVVPRPPPPPANWASLDTRPAPDAAVASVTESERAIAATYLQALSSGDDAALGRVLADEVHFTLAGLETTAVYGRAAVARAHAALFAAYPTRTFAATRVLVTEHQQSIEWAMTGKDKETGKPVGIRGVVVISTNDDGTIQDLHLYFDQGVLQAQVSGQPAEIAGLPLVAAPAAPVQRIEQNGGAAERADAAAVAHWLDALETDENAYAAAATDDVELATPQRATPAAGKPALRAYFEMMHRTISRLDTQLDSAIGVGPYVVAEYHVVGVQRAKYLYVPVKDPVIKVGSVDVIEMKDGKIARVWRYDDPLEVLQP